jgi:hypothetical protein
MFLIKIYLRERPETHNLRKLMYADGMRERERERERERGGEHFCAFFSLSVIPAVSRNCLGIRYYAV